MHTATVKTILVPGAWMGAWIWEPTAKNLTKLDIDAEAVTLRGLEPAQSDSTVSAVRLADHVRQLVEHVSSLAPRPVVLVSHSYSTLPTALAADRLGGQVRGLIHIGGFPPIDGRSLLDDWGDSSEDRAQERADVTAAGNLWLPPERQMLDFESDLTPADRDFLAERFTPHPGRTITDPVRLASPVGEQPSTYVALSLHGGEEEAWEQAPQVAKDASNWRRKHLKSGHWPMTSAPEATTDLIAEEITFYSGEGD
ncbi:alpha/beta hydrolase [Mobilicoccus sp.]|uniref:alpha/beta fold hydrolase n=1 Tax=Mobilicoccus sp. TaxID=2034349 RepID=UPI0028AD100E|nr:alpha/beta hydrolase [Mobilicoccus sp.]